MPETQPATDWKTETLAYNWVHPRLVAMSRLAQGLPGRRLLDVGCSAGTFGRLLPGFEYFGCDVAEHARAELKPGHFEQLDLNGGGDVSVFADRGIDTVNIGGVLEYIAAPGELLAKLARIVRPGGYLVLSMVNFEADRYVPPATHHADWKYKPRLEDLLKVVEAASWDVQRVIPFVGPSGWRTPFLRMRLRSRGPNHRWTRKTAWLFFVVARARC